MGVVAAPQQEDLGAPRRARLDLGPGPGTRRQWLRDLWGHRAVIAVLSRKDFQARYKRASLGILWVVAVPLLQAIVLTAIFSNFVRFDGTGSYAAYVLSGILVWSYFSITLPFATSSIVDQTALTDKLWFPRAILPLVPCFSNLVGLAISLLILLVAAPIAGAPLTLNILLLIPATALLVLFMGALSMTLSALNVYFRDVRFIVTAALLVWLYATPILYPKAIVGSLGKWLDLNPMTGIVSLFHVAVLGEDGDWQRATIISVVVTFLLLVIAMEIHRRRDRQFVDLL